MVAIHSYRLQPPVTVETDGVITAGEIQCDVGVVSASGLSLDNSPNMFLMVAVMSDENACHKC